MGVYSGPEISSDGLVLALDAGNSKGFDDDENLVVKSSQIGVSPDYSGGGIIGLNTTATTAPNNLFEASLLDNNGNTSTNYVFGGGGISLTVNTTYTYSIHIKQGTKPDFQITIDENGFGGKRYYSVFTYSTETITTGITGAANDGVVLGSSVTKLPNNWYRLELSFRTSTTSVSGFVDMINRFGNTSGSNYVWGRQLEYSSSASPYYATVGSIKNRGSTLIDLTGRSNNGTLTNGPTYSSANGGSIVFDGTNDYISISQTLTTPFTITGFVRYTDQAKTLNTFINTNPHPVLAISLNRNGVGDIYVYIGNGSGWLAAPSIISSTNMIVNQWYQVAFTSTGSGSTLYLNGTSVGTSIYSPSGWGSTYYLGTIIIASGEYLKGNIGTTQIYNRALTAAEIQQNFNATRGRYGI